METIWALNEPRKMFSKNEIMTALIVRCYNNTFFFKASRFYNLEIKCRCKI